MQLRRQQSTLHAVRARSSLMEPGIGRRSMSTSVAEPKWKSTIEQATSNAERPRPPKVVEASLGPFGTAKRIIQREGFFSLYKGLTAVWTGIVPKMAIRFLTFEQYVSIVSLGIHIISIPTFTHSFIHSVKAYKSLQDKRVNIVLRST